MKRFCVALLSLGLLVAFSTAVFAADVKFSGEYFIRGWYNKNASLIDKNDTATTIGNRGSSAFYTQRLRMGMDIEVAKGLKLGARFDALDRKWMAARLPVVAGNGNDTTDNEKENIGFDVAYVQFLTPIGLFFAGNLPSGPTGTPFLDYTGWTDAAIGWGAQIDQWIISAAYKKNQDGFLFGSGTPIGGGTDNDIDIYNLRISNGWNTGEAGMTLTFIRAGSYYPLYEENKISYVTVWGMQKFGRIYVEDEARLIFGGTTAADFLNPAVTDIDNGWSLGNYFNINVDLAPAKIGFMFVYSQGDDPTTPNKKEGGHHWILGDDKSFNPCLILFDYDYQRWMGPINGNQTPIGFGLGAMQTSLIYAFDNVWLYQLYGDIKATPKLTFGASLTYAYADEKPAVNYVSDKYGWELDATMKYKIYDNLEYMIGAAYLWTGDYFKGTNANVKLSDNYLLTHKLTLTF